MTDSISPLPHFPSRILVIDDDPFVGTVVFGVFSGIKGVTVKVCASGHAAVNEAALFQPDLILLDFLMPGMDGHATWKTLRDLLSPMPTVIFLTARDDPSFLAGIDALRADNPHICGVLPKPFEPPLLLDHIARLLGTGGTGAERRAPREPAAKTRRLAAVAEAFRRSLPATSARMSEAWSKLHEKGWARDAAEAILADAHSLAGSAGLFDLKAISAAAHDAERLLLNALKLERAPDAMELRALTLAITALIAACRAVAVA